MARFRAHAVAMVAVLLTGGSLWLAYGPGADVREAAPVPAAAPEPVPAPVSEPRAPESPESCADTSDAARCEKREAVYDGCEAAGFTGRRCLSSAAVHRDQESFLDDCRRADEAVHAESTCARMEDAVGEAYRVCRFAGGTDRRCEAPTVYTACVHRGGGSLCGDAAPV
ncbi:MAG: hypothetical protein HOV97_10725 [Nonomuraea sp.]|nr:hypothetical protein [Nonomuraea sp.]